MSGHSKWATTKHQKAIADKKRSNQFSKLANAISVAARSGGDPSMNFQLRLAVDRAKAASMPKENIERSLRRAQGKPDEQLESITYEIYGPSGTAIIVEAATDNKNRTSAEIKAVLNKFGGKLASSGAVEYLFERKGEIRVRGKEKGESIQEETELIILDSGADDYKEMPASSAGGSASFLVWTKPGELKAVKDYLNSKNISVESFELAYSPKVTVEIPDEDADKAIKLLEALDDLDDVTSVSSNLG